MEHIKLQIHPVPSYSQKLMRKPKVLIKTLETRMLSWLYSEYCQDDGYTSSKQCIEFTKQLQHNHSKNSFFYMIAINGCNVLYIYVQLLTVNHSNPLFCTIVKQIVYLKFKTQPRIPQLHKSAG